MSEPAPGFAARWWTFVRERFEPIGHVLMAGAFFAGNAGAARLLVGSRVSAGRAICGGLAVLIVFLRLRIFDEIKDHLTDRDAHPERPLARGLISPAEAKAVAAALAVLEAALALCCGLPALTAWFGVLVFSLLMYREFFVGAWLRPKMELYAVTHTLVAGWMGLLAAAAASGIFAWEMPAGLWLMVPANWAVFNVFEFARKTWGADEERPGIESYSGRLRPAGAAALSVGQVLLAAGMIFAALRAAGMPRAALWTALGLSVPTAAASLFYVVAPRRAAARTFRGVMTAFILGSYLTLAAAPFLRGPGR
jgi:4-hydroxybenzoate polyprenyltransferase